MSLYPRNLIIKIILWSQMWPHAGNPNTQESEAEDFEFETSVDYTTYLTNNLPHPRDRKTSVPSTSLAKTK